MEDKKIIAAIGKESFFAKLKEKVNLICNDIQYIEGILEYLELNKDLDYIVINDCLPGNIQIDELIKIVEGINEEIKIIIVSIELNDRENYIIENAELSKVMSIIRNKNMEMSNVYKTQNIPINNLYKKSGKLISILGPNGIGKSIFSIILSKNIKNRRILIIDFDVLNNNLHTILGVEEYSQIIQDNLRKNKHIDKQYNILDFIINTKLNIDLISGINLIFDSEYNINPDKIKKIINKLKAKYDLIVIDTSADCFLDFTKEIVKLSNELIFISGANILEIKKAKKLLDIYTNEWGEENEKFKIIFNKCTKKSVDDTVLKNVFKNYKIIGKVKLSSYYDVLINENKYIGLDSEINKIRKKVFN